MRTFILVLLLGTASSLLADGIAYSADFDAIQLPDPATGSMVTMGNLHDTLQNHPDKAAFIKDTISNAIWATLDWDPEEATRQLKIVEKHGVEMTNALKDEAAKMLAEKAAADPILAEKLKKETP